MDERSLTRFALQTTSRSLNVNGICTPDSAHISLSILGPYLPAARCYQGQQRAPAVLCRASRARRQGPHTSAPILPHHPRKTTLTRPFQGLVPAQRRDVTLHTQSRNNACITNRRRSFRADGRIQTSDSLHAWEVTP